MVVKFCNLQKQLTMNKEQQKYLDGQKALVAFNEKYPNGITSFKQYQKEASRTLNPAFRKQDINLPVELAHLMLGIVDEMDEFVEEIENYENTVEFTNRCVKELGDVWWYLANFYTLTNIDIGEVNGEYVLKSTSKLAGMVKKYLAYEGYVFDLQRVQILLNSINKDLLNCCEELNINMYDVLTANIQKLYQRFPEKFDSELAINKDESKENI